MSKDITFQQESLAKQAIAPPLHRTKGRPRKDDDARRDSILDAAYRAFVELGYTATTTDQVAARCHMSKQTLYRLFASKEALFRAVVARHRRLMLDLPRPEEEDLPVVEALAHIFCLHLDEAAERERGAFIHVVLRDANHVPGLVESFLQEGALRSRQELACWLEQQQQRGKIQIDHPLSVAQMLMDIAFATPPPLRFLPVEGAGAAYTRYDHLTRCFAIFERGVRP